MKRVIFALGVVILFATCKKDVPQKQLTVNVTPDVGGSVTPSSGTYAMGSNVKLLATPSPEYLFKEWSGGYSGTTNPASIIMDVDKTITAVFEKREYPLSLTIIGSGAVKEEIIKIAGASTNYKSGTTVRLTPQPIDGYQFKGWSGDDTTSKSPLDLIISKATNLTCTFEKEEAIKFSTNLDTGSYNVLDTLPLVITVSSKLPKAGILYSILINWTDSSKQIFKLDTSLFVSSLSLKIPGLKKSGTYSLSVTVTSKSSSSNTLNKSIPVVNSPLGRFVGYKVATNARQLGTDYWENSILPSDLIVAVFQKNYENHHPSGAYAVWTEAICNGDFNNDGYMDVFNGGTTFGGQIKATISFLIWNPITKIFEEKNLINDKTNNLGHPRLVTPVYLNSDNYVDIVIHGMRDEASNSNPNEPVSICLSDGKGGYDITKLDLEPKSLANQFGHEWGDVEDVTGDGLPDLFVSANSHTYIFWGISTFPYFTNINFAHFSSDTKNYPSDNGFGEVVPSGAGAAYGGVFLDVNKDGQRDLLLAVGENGIQPNGNKDQQRVLLNKGKGRFNETGVIKLPLYSNQINAGINQFDYKVDDLNGDGRLDIIAVNSVKYSQWNIVIYIQQTDGSFVIDNSLVEYNLNTISRPQYKTRLVYSDLNGDGLKDISYINSSITPYYMLQNNELLTKSVFIRVGNKFVEKDYYQFDPYAKSLKDKYYK